MDNNHSDSMTAIPDVPEINSDDYTLADFMEYSDKDLFVKAKRCYEYCKDWRRKGSHQYLRPLTSASMNRVMMFDEELGI